MAELVCLDAGVVAKLFLPERGRDRAERLMEELDKAGAEIVVPAFFTAEVLSVLRNNVVRGRLDPAKGEAAARWVVAFLGEVRQVEAAGYYQRAWELAIALNWPTIYDTVYLAVAEIEGADFWTADEGIYRAASDLARHWVNRLMLL